MNISTATPRIRPVSAGLGGSLINFRDPNDVLPSALIVLAILLLLGTLLFMLLVKSPSVEGIAQGRGTQRQQLMSSIEAAKTRIKATHLAIAPKLWQGGPDTISAAVLAQITANAQGHKLDVSAFRPQRTVDLGEVTELPFTVQLSGRYQGIHAVLASLDTAQSKLVLTSVQMAAAQTTGSGVTATVGFSAYVAADPQLLPPPAGKTAAPRLKGKRHA